MRLIDAGALMEALGDERSYIMNDPEIDTATRFYGVAMLRSFGSMVAKQPTIEAGPVVHGRWIHDINNLYGCSVCGERDVMKVRTKRKFCSYCGAKMDGRGEGE